MGHLSQQRDALLERQLPVNHFEDPQLGHENVVFDVGRDGRIAPTSFPMMTESLEVPGAARRFRYEAVVLARIDPDRTDCPVRRSQASADTALRSPCVPPSASSPVCSRFRIMPRLQRYPRFGAGATSDSTFARLDGRRVWALRWCFRSLVRRVGAVAVLPLVANADPSSLRGC